MSCGVIPALIYAGRQLMKKSSVLGFLLIVIFSVTLLVAEVQQIQTLQPADKMITQYNKKFNLMQVEISKLKKEIAGLKAEIKTLKDVVNAFKKVIKITGPTVNIQSEASLHIKSPVILMNEAPLLTYGSVISLKIPGRQLIGVGRTGAVQVVTPYANLLNVAIGK
jgi:hypothetical protein